MDKFQIDYNIGLNFQKTQKCQSESRRFLKNYVVINNNKSEYCLELYGKLIDFDNEKFKGYLVSVKAQMKVMETFRQNFLCKLCDVHQQKYFSLAKKEIYFAERQCLRMLSDLEPLIKFLNIMLFEYVEFLIQFKNCYDSDPRLVTQPLEGFLIKYKRRIPLIRKCYANVNGSGGVGFMKDCWFLCRSFNWNKISPVFEGDLQMIQRLFFSLYSFVRRARNTET